MVSNILREVENNRRRSLPSSRAEKRNKHARVLTVRQALQVRKNGGIFVDRLNNRGYELCMLSKYFRYGSNTLTYLTYQGAGVLFSFGINFFGQKTVSEPFFPAIHTKFFGKRVFILKHSSYIAYL